MHLVCVARILSSGTGGALSCSRHWMSCDGCLVLLDQRRTGCWWGTEKPPDPSLYPDLPAPGEGTLLAREDVTGTHSVTPRPGLTQKP